MKLVYYSSVLNHHQRGLCDAFYKMLGDDFLFVETMEMEEHRIRLGYQKEDVPYVLKSHISEENKKKAIKAAVECDVFLAGVFPVEILHERMKKGKLTFRHIETYFKRGRHRLFTPNALRIAYDEHCKYRNKPLYLLCASGHVAKDVDMFFAYPDKKFKWGYFPIIDCGNEVLANKENEVIEIVWAGRMIAWKKPEYAIKTVYYLKEKGYQVHLNMIGTGDMLLSLEKMIDELGVEKEVTLCGSMSPTEVRRYMREADIFLFTSTREEGWGAVLNEAMGSGCAVVASADAGSTGYLVRDDVNGLIYANNSCKELQKQTEMLCANSELRKRLAKKAYGDIKNVWNHDVAANRFLEVAEALLQSKEFTLYKDGPMSRG